MKITISKSQWEAMGRKANWMQKEALQFLADITKLTDDELLKMGMNTKLPKEIQEKVVDEVIKRGLFGKLYFLIMAPLKYGVGREESKEKVSPVDEAKIRE